MIYKCKIFDSKIPDVVLIYALIYPSIFNQKRLLLIITPNIITFPPNPRHASVH